MRILVNYVAAEDGGGLFVLKNFYNDVLKYSPKNYEWIFFVSTNEISSAENIKVVNFSELKQSYLKRTLFDFVTAPKLIRQYNPDAVVSLQNMPITGVKAPQFVYLHQSLQYCPVRFSLFKREERSIAFRQKFICGMYKRLLPKSEHIFVQTKWMKAATEKWIDFPKDKITVVPVTLDADDALIRPYDGGRVFFYPARAEIYKNHSAIIDAVKSLCEGGESDFKVLLTFDKNSNAYSAALAEKAMGLPIEFIGAVPYEKMWDYYSKSVLLFPSYLETCGLPLLEARRAGAKILTSDMPFAHEALEGYGKAEFFTFDNPQELADKMLSCLNNKNAAAENSGTSLQEETSLLREILKAIEKLQ